MFVTDKEIPLPVLAQLRLTTHQFYLTGSRRFGGGDERSDWDFFTPEHGEIRTALAKWGFGRLSPFGYASDVEVWRHKTEHIDVQIRKNVDEFEAACQLVEGSKVIPPKGATARTAFWTAILHIIRRPTPLGIASTHHR